MFPLPEKNVVNSLPSSSFGVFTNKEEQTLPKYPELINQKSLKMFQKRFLRTRCLDLQKDFPRNLKPSLDTQDSTAESMIPP